LQRPEAVPVQEPSSDDQEQAEDQEPDVPRQRATEVVPDVVHAEDLVVDQPLDDVEDAPAVMG